MVDKDNEPTIDWLIDEICPNNGKSPLLNFNKDRLKALISKEVTLGKIGLLESILQASTVANSPAFNPLTGVGRIEIEDLIKELQATLMEEES